MTQNAESGSEDCHAEPEPITRNPQVCGHGRDRRRVTLLSHRRSIYNMIAQLNVLGRQGVAIDIQVYQWNFSLSRSNNEQALQPIDSYVFRWLV